MSALVQKTWPQWLAAPALPTWTSGLAVHMFLIGLPIVIAARRAFCGEA